MFAKCFLCAKESEDARLLTPHESTFLLNNVLNIPHWVEDNIQRMKFQNLWYCENCVNKIINVEEKVAYVEMLEREVVEEKTDLVKLLLESYKMINSDGQSRGMLQAIRHDIITELNNKVKGGMVSTSVQTVDESKPILKDCSLQTIQNPTTTTGTLTVSPESDESTSNQMRTLKKPISTEKDNSEKAQETKEENETRDPVINMENITIEEKPSPKKTYNGATPLTFQKETEVKDKKTSNDVDPASSKTPKQGQNNPQPPHPATPINVNTVKSVLREVESKIDNFHNSKRYIIPSEMSKPKPVKRFIFSGNGKPQISMKRKSPGISTVKGQVGETKKISFSFKDTFSTFVVDRNESSTVNMSRKTYNIPEGMKIKKSSQQKQPVLKKLKCDTKTPLLPKTDPNSTSHSVPLVTPTVKMAVKIDFNCSDCPQIFSSKDSLDKHIEEEHGYSIKCRACMKGFSSQCSLVKHLLQDCPAK